MKRRVVVEDSVGVLSASETSPFPSPSRHANPGPSSVSRMCSQASESVGRLLATALRGSAARLRPREATSVLDRLRKTPHAQLDDTVRMLIRTRDAEEVRQAMVELIKEIPLSDFPVFKRVYFKHFAA